MAPRSDGYSYERGQLVRRMCILSGVTLALSIIAIIIGILQVSHSDGRFPFNAGGAMIGGFMSLFFTICPCCMYIGLWFDCCMMTMVIWWGLTILALPVGLGISGAYGLAECLNPTRNEVCVDNTETKLLYSVLTIIVTAILIIITAAIFFTCCCNAKTFGEPIIDTSVRYTPDDNRSGFTYSETGNFRSANVGRQRNDAISTDRNTDIGELSVRLPPLTDNEQVGGLSVRLPPLSNHDNDYSVGLSVNLPPLDSRNRETAMGINIENEYIGAERIGPGRDGVAPPNYADLPPSYEEALKLQVSATVV